MGTKQCVDQTWAGGSGETVFLLRGHTPFRKPASGGRELWQPRDARRSGRLSPVQVLAVVVETVAPLPVSLSPLPPCSLNV